MANETPLTPDERDAFAEVLKRVQASRFDGKAKDAYTAADVNSGTWDRLIKGLSVKAYTVTGVVNRLWPDTGGDWRQVPGLVLRSEPHPSRFSRAFSAAFAKLAADAGVTREQLSGATGRSVDAISEALSGGVGIDIDLLNALADLTKSSLQDVIGRVLQDGFAEGELAKFELR